MAITHPYEVIVIGSGATGGVAALTFAEAGVRVLVIEAGPFWSSQQALGTEPGNTFRRITGIISGTHRLQSQHPGYWKANPLLYSNEKDNPYTFPKENPFIWTQGRQVGGRSLTWGGITLRLSDLDFKASTRDGFGPVWPIEYSELAPHYSVLEKRLKVHGHKDGLKQLPDGHFIDPLPFTPSEKQFAKSLKENLGYQVIHSRGFGPHQPNTNGQWPRSSSPGSTLQIAIKTGNVEILSNHMAESLVMSPDRNSAKGVVVVDQTDGSRKELKANLIVLCASTIQTIRLLLSSEEKNNNKGFIDPSSKLGSYLMDHISTCRFFALPERIKSINTTSNAPENVLSGAGSFFIPFGNKFENSSNLKFIRGYGIWGGIDRFEPPKFLKLNPETKTGFLIGHGEVLASPNNKVTLSKKLDRWGVHCPHIDCKWMDNEKAMVLHMNETIERSIKAAGGSMLPFNELIRVPFAKQILERAIAIQKEPPPPGYYVHEVGGAPMGTKEESSVLDQFNRIWRCPNVLVVDGSCWPTSSWQSPTLTMMAITRRACIEALRYRNE